MIERTIDIATNDGATTTFIVHPERGGPRPLVLFLMDAPGIREELRDMVRRIAAVGYYVMLPNLFYREGLLELPPLPPEQSLPRMYRLIATLDIPKVMADCDAAIDFADRDRAASPGAAAVIGYCMSGQFAISVAARQPERFAAAASIYGTDLVTDRADSPHHAAAKARAELYFAFGERDPHIPLADVRALEVSLKGRASRWEVEVYPGADHGFAFRERPKFHKPSAERHWERLFALFRRQLA